MIKQNEIKTEYPFSQRGLQQWFQQNACACWKWKMQTTKVRHWTIAFVIDRKIASAIFHLFFYYLFDTLEIILGLNLLPHSIFLRPMYSVYAFHINRTNERVRHCNSFSVFSEAKMWTRMEVNGEKKIVARDINVSRNQ